MTTIPAPTSAEADPFRPATLDEFVGQPRLKDDLGTAIDGALAANRAMGHVLLTALPGSGKTTLAALVAERLGYRLVENIAPLTAREARTAIVDMEIEQDPGTPRVLWFVDEIHAWNRAAQEVLLPVLANRTYDTGWGPEPCPWLTVMVATTDRIKVTGALLDRFDVEPSFDPYTVEDLATITGGMARRLGLDLPHDLATGLARAAAGSPRQAGRLVKRTRDLRDAGREVSLDAVLRLCRISHDGYTARQIDLLRILHRNAGPAGEALLCNQLGIAASELADLEAPLIRTGAIRRQPNGRALTRRGADVVRTNPDL